MIRIDNTKRASDQARDSLCPNLEQLADSPQLIAQAATLALADRFGLVVVPLLPDKRIVLRVRYCYSAARWSLELPWVTAQKHEGGWRRAARQCLATTTGMRTSRWSLLGDIYFEFQAVASCMFIVLAKNCQPLPAGSPPDCNQDTATLGFSIGALQEMIREGEIICGVTLATLAIMGIGTRR